MQKYKLLGYIATVIIFSAFAIAVECLCLWYITEVWGV